MKKLLSFLLIATISVSIFAFAACETTEPTDNTPVNVNIIMPDGAPVLTFAKLIAENTTFDGYNLNYEIAVPSAGLEAPQIVASKMTNGDADIAVMPTNTAATLYNRGVDIKVVANNIWGNIYMISKGEVITDLNTLKGKVVFNISENGSPDLVFKHILTENDIDYTSEYVTGEDDMPIPVAGKVVLAYKPPTELIPAIKQNKIEYGILGEPAITNALNVIGEPAKVVLDLQEEWADVTGLGRSYAQACLVVSNDFLSANVTFVNNLIASLSASDEYLTGDSSDTNIAAAKTAFQTYAASTSLANITKDTVVRSNVETVATADAKDDIIAYLSAIYALNPAALGGAMPDDGFYYLG